jgi:hypothetical protein
MSRWNVRHQLIEIQLYFEHAEEFAPLLGIKLTDRNRRHINKSTYVPIPMVCYLTLV